MPPGVYLRKVTPLERFLPNIDFNGHNGCWIWKLAKAQNGYGIFWLEGDNLAHRAAYKLLRGPIPKDLVIDHLCRVRHCVNPFHMELVTRAENCLRGESLNAQNARKKFCIRGHELPLRIDRARGKCRPCHLEYMRKWHIEHPYKKQAAQ